jgi:hypothetical protein
METEEQKSANQLWRESGTSLTFKDWIEREKEKGNFMLNKKVQDTITSLKDKMLNTFDAGKNIDNKQNNTNSFVGLSKVAVGLSIFIIIGSIAYTIYQKRK